MRTDIHRCLLKKFTLPTLPTFVHFHLHVSSRQDYSHVQRFHPHNINSYPFSIIIFVLCYFIIFIYHYPVAYQPMLTPIIKLISLLHYAINFYKFIFVHLCFHKCPFMFLKCFLMGQVMSKSMYVHTYVFYFSVCCSNIWLSPLRA